jgi:hypothetical protein
LADALVFCPGQLPKHCAACFAAKLDGWGLQKGVHDNEWFLGIRLLM